MSESKALVRESNFELLRIFSMFVIILYHLIRFFVEGHHPDENFWSAIQLPLHVGVILFVLISGYFGINTRAKGISRLLVLTFVYYVPFALLQSCSNLYLQISSNAFEMGGALLSDASMSLKNVLYSFLFLSKGPYWFVRTYLWLYLLAPAVNLFINQSDKHLSYLLVTTGIISLYMGFVGGLDPSLVGGKNIINFIFLYCLGRCIHNKQGWKRFKTSTLVPVYVIFNFILFTSFYLMRGTFVGDIIYHLFFPYDSVGLVFNSLLLFLIFGEMNIRSQFVNTIAASTFAMYLFHHQPVILHKIIMPLTNIVDMAVESISLKFIALILFTVIIITVTVMIDRIIMPMTEWLESRLTTTIEQLLHNTCLKNGFGK